LAYFWEEPTAISRYKSLFFSCLIASL